MMSKNAKRKRDAIAQATRSNGYAHQYNGGAYDDVQRTSSRLTTAYTVRYPADVGTHESGMRLLKVSVTEQQQVTSAHSKMAFDEMLSSMPAFVEVKNLDTPCKPIGHVNGEQRHAPTMRYTGAKGRISATRLRHKFKTRRA